MGIVGVGVKFEQILTCQSVSRAEKVRLCLWMTILLGVEHHCLLLEIVDSGSQGLLILTERVG